MIKVRATHWGRKQLELYACLISRSGRSALLYNVHDGLASKQFFNLGRYIEDQGSEQCISPLSVDVQVQPDSWMHRVFSKCWSSSIDGEIGRASCRERVCQYV